ncbi:MAG: sulfatase-like hydrolase/transferase [Verrucomicrobiota bacterium]
MIFYISGARAGSDLPNVIVILADDLGYADVGFHKVSEPDVSTPHLDQLAASGAVFEDAYSSSPVCSNSRLSLLTGRYAQRWGAYYYGQGGLPTSEKTTAEMLLKAGYRTMKVGKTHLNKGPKEPPTKHGFERSLSFIHHSWDFNMLSQKDVDAYNRKKPGSAKQATQCPFGPLTRNDEEAVSFENTTTTEVFGQESIRFIKEKSDKPFYLQLEFNAVHTPLIRPPEQLAEKYGIPLRPFDRDAEVWEFPLWDPVRQPDFKVWYSDTCHLKVVDPYGRKIYLAHLELMDSVIGQIMQTLEDKGIAENTLIFFSSDNGGSDQSYANNGTINGYKYSLINGGIQVPMILSWPKGIPAGTRIGATVTHRDLYASLAEIVGVTPEQLLDGKSLLPLISGEAEALHTGPIFWDSGQKQQNWVARQGDWKLLYYGKGRSYQSYELDEQGLVKPKLRTVRIEPGLKLYNLADDPGETKDLAQQHPERVSAMQKLYTQWRSGMSDEKSGRNAK